MADENVSTDTVSPETVIAEVTEKIVEEVVKEVQKEIIEHKVEDIESAVTTVLTEEVKLVAKKMGLDLLSDSKLTDDQLKLASKIYISCKDASQTIMTNKDTQGAVKVTLLLGQLAKHLENVKLDGHKPTGADKKIVAIELGRIFIKDYVTDAKQEEEILAIYDIAAGTTLEALIDVSKVASKIVEEVSTKCCMRSTKSSK